MGSIGDCFDNAVIESFWARMQVELLNRRRWKTRVELANAIFEYLEIFHNRQRRHSTPRDAHPDRARKTRPPGTPGRTSVVSLAWHLLIVDASTLWGDARHTQPSAVA
jgi:Integrase core domain